jgi:hypothetical protein
VKAWKAILAAVLLFAAGAITGAAVSRIRTRAAVRAELAQRTPLPAIAWQRYEFLRRAQRDLKLTDKVAEMTYTELMTKGSGLAKDCAFDMQGFRNVLALRAEIEGQWGGNPPPAERYVDLRWHEGALRRLA